MMFINDIATVIKDYKIAAVNFGYSKQLGFQCSIRKVGSDAWTIGTGKTPREAALAAMKQNAIAEPQPSSPPALVGTGEVVRPKPKPSLLDDDIFS